MSDRESETASSSSPLAPALSVRDARAAIRWYEKVLGAEELLRLSGPDGTVIHAELRVADCLVMLGEEAPEQGSLAPQSIGGTPVRLHLYVEDVDDVARRAVEEGAEVLIPVEDQF